MIDVKKILDSGEGACYESSVGMFGDSEESSDNKPIELMNKDKIIDEEEQSSENK